MVAACSAQQPREKQPEKSLGIQFSTATWKIFFHSGVESSSNLNLPAAGMLYELLTKWTRMLRCRWHYGSHEMRYAAGFPHGFSILGHISHLALPKFDPPQLKVLFQNKLRFIHSIPNKILNTR